MQHTLLWIIGISICAFIVYALLPEKIPCGMPLATCATPHPDGYIINYDIQPRAITRRERNHQKQHPFTYRQGEDLIIDEVIIEIPDDTDPVTSDYDLVISETAVGGRGNHVFTMRGIRKHTTDDKERYSIDIKVNKEYIITLEEGSILQLDPDTALLVEAIIPAEQINDDQPGSTKGKVMFNVVEQ